MLFPSATKNADIIARITKSNVFFLLIYYKELLKLLS